MSRPTVKRLDFSSGDPLIPFKRLASHAFREASKDLNVYQVTSMAGLFQPVGTILSHLSDYFTTRSFYPEGWSGLGTHNMLMTGGGTTEAYELVIRMLGESARKQPGMKPVIVMPVPTYGFFFRNPENWGIEVVPIERDWRGDGQLDTRKLWELFQTLTKQGKRIVAYYDCNPHNPLGKVRTPAETQSVARVIAYQNHLYDMENREHGLSREDLLSRVNIIDDMIYSGLEYDAKTKAAGFAQLERVEEFQGIFRHTFTLFGPSKAGLVNLRAGLVIGHSHYIDEMRELQKTTSYFPPKMSMHALEAFYSDQPPMAGWRKTHLDAMNEQHRFGGVLMKILVNGLKDADELSEADLTRIRKLVPDAARLSRGIPGLEIITTPDAGFFHLLDFSGLKGTVYSNEHVHYKSYSGVTPFTGEESIDHLSASHSISFAYGSWAGLKMEDSVVRVTFAKPVPDILEFAKRLEKMTAACVPPKTEPAPIRSWAP